MAQMVSESPEAVAAPVSPVERGATERTQFLNQVEQAERLRSVVLVETEAPGGRRRRRRTWRRCSDVCIDRLGNRRQSRQRGRCRKHRWRWWW